MRIQEMQHSLLLMALLSTSLLIVVVNGDTFLPSSPRAAFVPRSLLHERVRGDRGQRSKLLISLRGGATIEADEDEEIDLDSDDEEEEVESEAESEEEEEEEEEESAKLDASLAAAALKSTEKTKAKIQSSKTLDVKKTVNAKLAAAPSKKKKVSLLKILRVPYIIRACLNPFTVFSMTKHYWLSLFNLDYPPKEVSQDLRMSLEEKARKGGSAPSHARGKRKMKRGQAKTLSDLPKLNT